MADKLTVTPILVLQGRLQDTFAPYAVSFSGRGSHAGVSFHALVETPAADPQPLCQRLLDILQRSILGQGRSSLTTALSTALQDSHHDLLAANENTALATQVGAGITCLALRDEDVYIARAGPGALYHRDSHGVRTINPAPPAQAEGSEAEETHERSVLGLGPMQTPEETHRSVLGPPMQTPVTLERQALLAGQVLLAAHSSLANSVSYDGLMTILSSSPEDAAGRLELLMQDDPVFAALLVSRAD